MRDFGGSIFSLRLRMNIRSPNQVQPDRARLTWKFRLRHRDDYGTPVLQPKVAWLLATAEGIRAREPAKC